MQVPWKNNKLPLSLMNPDVAQSGLVFMCEKFFFGFCLVKVLLVYDENHFGVTGKAVNRGYKGTNEFK